MSSTPMISTESYDGVARGAHTATEGSIGIWKVGAKAITVPVDLVSTLPSVNLTPPVERYFEYAQKGFELNRDLATTWTETVMSLFGVMREHAQKVSRIVKDETETVADLARDQADQLEQAAREQAEKVEQAAREQAEKVKQAELEQAREAKRVEREEAQKAQQQAEEAEEAEKAQAREAKRVERAEAKKAHEEAREAYEGLTKAELSDQLEARGLPKTGNVDELIERLVSADSE